MLYRSNSFWWPVMCNIIRIVKYICTNITRRPAEISGAGSVRFRLVDIASVSWSHGRKLRDHRLLIVIICVIILWVMLWETEQFSFCPKIWNKYYIRKYNNCMLYTCCYNFFVYIYNIWVLGAIVGFCGNILHSTSRTLTATSNLIKTGPSGRIN